MSGELEDLQKIGFTHAGVWKLDGDGIRNRSQSILWRRFVLTTTCSGIWPQ